MKIKRMTRLGILAVALLAILGIATVSFAAWGNENKTVSFAAATGEVDLIGFKGGAELDLNGAKFVPYDQPEEDDLKGGVRFVSVALPEYEVTGSYTITVTSSNASLKFFVQVGAKVEAAPSATTDWKEVTTTGAVFEETVTFTDPDKAPLKVNNEGNVTKYLSIILDSSTSTDMNQNTTFTVTLDLANA